MNGEQQKERRGEIVRLDKDLARIEQATLEAWAVEVDARQKADEGLKSLVASMIDAETQFRQRAILVSEQRLTKLHNDITESLLTFIKLPWWKRYLWVVFGAKSMEWFPSPYDQGSESRRRETLQKAATTDIRAGYKGEKPQ